MIGMPRGHPDHSVLLEGYDGRMNLLFLIPARGGSKGIQGKNLQTVGGVSLVGRAVRTALSSARVLSVPASRIIVSTDDDAIADEAREWGASVPSLRPASLATDTASTVDVAIHALNSLVSGPTPDRLVLLQPTSPFTSMDDVLACVRLSMARNLPVVSVVPARHLPEWAMTMDTSGTLTPLSARPPSRRQDATPACFLNGAVYVIQPDMLRAHQSFVPQGTLGTLMPDERSLDVDSPFDLQMANALAEQSRVMPIDVGGRWIGPGHPCFVIAEAGVNHNGRLDMALRLVDAAAEAKADAVKFQLYRAAEQASRTASTANYQYERTGAKSMLDMAQDYDLPWDAHHRIAAHCRQRGIMYMASCFDAAAVDHFRSIGGHCIKIGSGEITNIHLLKHIGRSGLPVLLSTGMSSLRDVQDAVDILNIQGTTSLGLFQCTSSYPAPHHSVNLRAMATLRSAFRVPVGLSDHTIDATAAVGAVVLGAHMIEKHFTLDKSLPGPDHAMSLDAGELVILVKAVRDAEALLGTEIKHVDASEISTRSVARRSIVASRAIRRGDLLSEANLTLKRPATGIDPRKWDDVCGRRAAVDIEEDIPLTWEMVQ